MKAENNLICLKYSTPIFILGLVAAISFLIFVQPVNFSWTTLFFVYLIASIIGTSIIFLYRIRTKGTEKTFETLELCIAGLSAFGLSLPLAIIGVFLAISRGEYTGSEKWLPEIQNPEKEIQRLIAELDLSEETQDRCLELLETVKNYGLLTGRSIAEMAAAIVYIAAREQNEPRTLEEISQEAGATKKEIGRAYRHIGRNTEIRIIPPQPADHLGRFTEQMDLSEDVQEQAREIIEEALETNITSGKSPKGIAASALYLASHLEKEDRTMNDMSNTLGITTITIRNRSRDLIEALNLENYPEHLED